MGVPCEDRDSKTAWRSRLLAARQAGPASSRAADARALTDAIATVTGNTVCGYLPVGVEPGSAAMLDALVAAGRRVLLPVVTGAAPLDWAEYTGPDALRPGPHGLREPAGRRLGPAAIREADTVLVPALAVDRRGVRLGRGGGHYDRSLPLTVPGTPLVAVIRDDEWVQLLPDEPHDVRMTAVLTPRLGLVELC
ncbi:MAG TPA: 5-formyltetrahydrofolate cyclo-ligase [Pseudonocardiaceae bacterium]|nr:5-formyltetrahydrofolate cyclo-ligase [Pseudonocardiaceae bacterium]